MNARKHEVSEELVDQYMSEALETVKTADYGKCPVPGQGNVQRFQTFALSSLLQKARNGDSNGNGNGNGHSTKVEFPEGKVPQPTSFRQGLWFVIYGVMIRAPWAAALLIGWLAFLYARSQGWLEFAMKGGQ